MKVNRLVSLLALLLVTPMAKSAPPATNAVRPATKPVVHPASAPATKPEIDLTPLPQTPGFHKLKFQTKVGDKTEKMAWLLFLPDNYKPQSEGGAPAPVLVFLHGAGEGGDDLSGIYIHGPARDLTDPSEVQLKESFPFIGIFPQCPPRGQRWDQANIVKEVVALLDQELPKLNADPDRVYCTGLSMGGKGTWYVALEAPNRFAALAPICADTANPESLDKLKYVSVLGIVGSNDGPNTAGTLAIAKLMRGFGDDFHLLVVPHEGHGVWPQCYSSPQFYEWLLMHRRLNAAEKKQRDTLIAATRDAHPPTTEPTTKGHDDPPVLQANGKYDPDAPPDQPLPKTPGRFLLDRVVKYGDATVDLPFEIYLPPGYDGRQKLPALLYLHDTNAIGTQKDGLFLHGPDAALDLKQNTGLRNRLEMIIVSPQLPPAMGPWDRPQMQESLSLLLDYVQKNFAIDPQRLSIAGQREGGLGAWKLATAHPERFAAIAVAFAGENPPAVAEKDKWPPTWCFSNCQLTTLLQLKEETAKYHTDVEFKVDGKLKAQQIGQAWEDSSLYDWLLEQHREAKQ